MKRSSTLVILCLLVAFVSLYGLFSNFGYPGRRLVTTAGSSMLLIAGFITVAGLWRKRKWSPAAVVVWVVVGVANNFLYYAVYRPDAFGYPVAAALFALLMLWPVLKRVRRDIEE